MLKEFFKERSTKGLRRSLRNVATELRINRIHRHGVRSAQRLLDSKDLRLHFGCGRNIKPGFVNIDLYEGSDFGLDLREPLPFPAGSCSMVYSEHFLEHLDYPEDAMLFLTECARILRPGGVFSVGVPDTEWPIRAYAGEPYYAGWFDYVKGVFPRSAWLTTQIELVNHSFRQSGQHKFAYDFETLKRNLEKVGLEQVKRRQFDPSLDSEHSRYSLDADGSRCTTLYLEAVKPAI